MTVSAKVQYTFVINLDLWEELPFEYITSHDLETDEPYLSNKGLVIKALGTGVPLLRAAFSVPITLTHEALVDLAKLLKLDELQGT